MLPMSVKEFQVYLCSKWEKMLVALSHGMCKNGLCDAVNESADSDINVVDPSPDFDESSVSDSITSDNFINSKLTQAFGASILRSDGGSFDDPWGT